jgi:hypothetical protein
LQPLCHVVSLTVVQQGGQYLLDGTDDQCGAGRKAGITGMAFLNPDGTVGFSLAIVTAPGGAPVHVDATIALTTLSGTWRDSSGASGAFVFTPGPAAPGSPRVIPTVGDVTAVNAAPASAAEESLERSRWRWTPPWSRAGSPAPAPEVRPYVRLDPTGP